MDGPGVYGIAQQASLDPRVAPMLDEIAERGFAIVPDVVDAATVATLNERLDAIYDRQCEEIGGAAVLSRLNDADIARCLLAYDERFLELAATPVILALARAMLGPNIVLLMQNGVLNRPDIRQFQANWHRDLNYQHFVSTRPLAMSALVTLERFTAETGGTVFLPGSHRREDFPSLEAAEQAAVAPEAPAGAAIVFDSMVFHRAGMNRSGKVRRAVNHVIGRPILAQQVDIPAMLDRPAPEDPELAGFLGYRWNTAASVTAWRARKL